MLPAILICAFMVKNIATQTVTAALGETKSCVLIGDDVKLLCTASPTCCSSPRKWLKVGVAASLLSNGVSSDPSKYVQEEKYVNGTSTGFNLIIKNVQTSDFGIKYKCQSGLIGSNELFLDNILCDCWKCARQDYGWSILGGVIGTGIILIIAIVKIGKLKDVLIVGGLTFLISAVVNLFALLIGYLQCHCVDGTGPWLIVLGLGTSGIAGVIALIFQIKQQGSSQGSNGSSCWPPCKVEQEPKNPEKPSSNEQPVKEKKKKKAAVEKRSTTDAKHIKTAHNETELIPTEKGFTGDLEKKRPLPPLTTQHSPTNRPLPLLSSARPLPQITTKNGDN